jgi:hypothetical protein
VSENVNEKKGRKTSPVTINEDLNKRTKKEWIESAPTIFKAECFEMAGALFDCKNDDLLSQQEVKKKLDAYLHPKEEANVDSTD